MKAMKKRGDPLQVTCPSSLCGSPVVVVWPEAGSNNEVFSCPCCGRVFGVCLAPQPGKNQLALHVVSMCTDSIND